MPRSKFNLVLPDKRCIFALPRLKVSDFRAKDGFGRHDCTI